MSEEKGGWETTTDAGSLSVGQVVRNDVSGHIGIVRKIEDGMATVGSTSEEELGRIDKSYRTRWA